MPTGTGLPLCHEYICRGGSCQEHRGIIFLMAIPVALCLRNNGSQTPDRRLKLARNIHLSSFAESFLIRTKNITKISTRQVRVLIIYDMFILLIFYTVFYERLYKENGPDNIRAIFFFIQCGRWDLNPHGIATTGT